MLIMPVSGESGNDPRVHPTAAAGPAARPAAVGDGGLADGGNPTGVPPVLWRHSGTLTVTERDDDVSTAVGRMAGPVRRRVATAGPGRRMAGPRPGGLSRPGDRSAHLPRPGQRP